MSIERKFTIQITKEQAETLFSLVFEEKTRAMDFFRRIARVSDPYLDDLQKLLDIVNVHDPEEK